MGLLTAEWVKSRSVRSTWVLAGAAALVTVLISLLGISGLTDAWRTALPPGFDPTAIGFKGILVGQVVVATLGARLITDEYASGQIATSLMVAPARGALFRAKLVVVAGVSLATALVSVAAGFGASQALLRGTGLPFASVADPHVLRAVACATGYLVLVGVLGFALGALTRSASGALGGVVAVTLVVPAVVSGVPGRVGELLASVWPTSAGQRSYVTVGASGGSAAGDLLVMGVWVAIAVVVARVLFTLRDA